MVRWLCAAALLGTLALLLPHDSFAQEDEAPLVLVMDINGPIEPITERYLARVIDQAETRGAEALVIRINTPGGLISSMRNLAEQLLNSPVPTVAYVWPSGAQAASAGTIVTIAAHVAAMAPATNIGAAAPVTGTGEDLPSTLRKKVDEDITALIRSISRARARNYDAIERTVLEAKAYTADEALDLNVIDHVVVDLDSLLNKIDGAEVETTAGTRILRTAGAQIDELGRSLVERFLDILTNPNLTYALILLGTYGVIYEIRDPGNFGPGVLGVLGLVLGFAGIGLLPVNFTGVVLLVAGIALLLLESQLDGFGWAGLGAVICWILAGFLLFGEIFPEPSALDDPLEISRWVLAVFGAVTASVIAMFWILGRGGGKSEAFIPEHERRLIARQGTVVDILNPSGNIVVNGEQWTAMTEGDDLSRGSSVVVTGVYAGGVLKVVEPRDAPSHLARSTWRDRLARLSLAHLIHKRRDR